MLTKGIFFSIVTCLLWGILPIILKVALERFSSSTIVWFRFFFSFFVIFCFLTWKNKKPIQLIAHPPVLSILAGVCLAINYYYFMIGLELSGPSNTAVIIQIAPILVVIAGIFIFKEKFNKAKTLGLLIAIFGFILFYLDQNNNSLNSFKYFTANSSIAFAAVAWAIYAIAMKKLINNHEAQNLNVLVYGFAAIILTPGVQWSEILKADALGWVLLVSLGLNTLLAYGCLVESLKYIPLSYISMISALNPFITMMSMILLSWFGFMQPENITKLGYVGAILAVSGVAWVVGK